MKVLLYYQFVDVKDAAKLVDETKEFCVKHELKGRILISHDGINGTVAGNDEGCDAYVKWMHEQPGFENLWFKEQMLSHNPFPRLQIRERKELVTLKLPVHPKDGAGKHLEPQEVNDMVAKHGENVVFFDARNEIESRIGKFKDAICPDITTFRELPQAIEKHKAELSGKKVIMYCTGGIRCETASVLMKEAVPESEVYQINGGIYNYCQSGKNNLWQGTCYVFDDRMQVAWDDEGELIEEVDLPQDKVLTKCELCDCKTSRVVNDERFSARIPIICCVACDEKNDISRLRTKEERKLRAQEEEK